ncbi:UxaA family hydrolase [Clostridium tyrobutyricum]|uniref:UxaA family hydrolase n=1 Tax=Clostridium tyrobutyricum TaxID=1519 RepID=UPI001C3D4E2C|nr:altronate dehydratase family protein [Clostridium tyrobutyricum]MBV4438320.1 altronate dehydratase family protein [Clostridium tyrobutyricum]
MKEIIKINNNDNVVIALKDLKKDDYICIDNVEVKLKEDINRGHKIATKKIENGGNIIKYGFPIGHAIKDIDQGEWIHTHNVKTNLSGIKKYDFKQKLNKSLFENEGMKFKGYRRENGSVGIRNELWIVPTVGCVNGIADKIIQRFTAQIGQPYIDNMLVLNHNYGCSQLGEDHISTRTILGDLVKHPNAGGVLVLGLGCENNKMDEFKKSLGEFNKNRTRFLICQEVSDEIEEGIKLLKELYDNMKKDKREYVPLSELKVGLKCGGSDGLSGITANPLLGKFSDFLIAQGGSTVLTEVPEMFGAEMLLMNRSKNEKIFNKIVHLINDFKEYFIQYNQPIYENPSPGNKAGGITTLEDKSLGCTQKSGTSTIVDVLKYGEVLKKKGLNLLSAPGNDLVAASALASSGCQMVLFTTGRGTPFGTFVPTMKISTNSNLFNNKPHWIDFNAGSLVEDKSEEYVLKKLIGYIISVASGEKVNNEKNDFRELAIFKSGVTL